MHIFLTGEIQIGKSTAIGRFLKERGLTAAGFRTVFADRQSPERRLHLLPAAYGICGEDNLAVRFQDGRPQVIRGAFDRLGPAELEKPGQIVLMDELGRFESGEAGFKAAVLAALDGPRPVLGVVRGGLEIPWLEAVKAHPGVEILTVTLDNRDAVPGILADMFNLGPSVK